MKNTYFSNEQWEVTDYGMESKIMENYYVGKNDLLRTYIHKPEGVKYYNWPVHMTGKPWSDFDQFFSAFCVAIAIHGEIPNAELLRKSLAFARLELRREAEFNKLLP